MSKGKWLKNRHGGRPVGSKNKNKGGRNPIHKVIFFASSTGEIVLQSKGRYFRGFLKEIFSQ